MFGFHMNSCQHAASPVQLQAVWMAQLMLCLIMGSKRVVEGLEMLAGG